MINCLLLDDEKPALDLLEDNLRQIPFLNITAVCRSPMEALEVIKSSQVDLVFLDIQMPGITGLELIRSLQRPPLIILVTAFKDYALDGYELNVLDYLVKPVPFARLLKAAQKAREMHEVRKIPVKTIPVENEHVFVNANYSLVKVMIQDITFIEGLKDYVRINMRTGKPVITRLGLKGVEEKLSAGRFMRVHKSYIIALDKIESIQKTQLIIGGQEIPIGDGYRQALQTYIQSKNL